MAIKSFSASVIKKTMTKVLMSIASLFSKTLNFGQVSKSLILTPYIKSFSKKSATSSTISAKILNKFKHQGSRSASALIT